MERKLIKQGGGGLTVYLPKKWTSERGMKEGESVSIIEKDSSLIVTGKSNEKKEINVEINDENRHDINVLLSHLYRKGFSKISLSNLDKKSIDSLKKSVPEMLLGFEITHKENNIIIIESITEPESNKYDIILKRIFFLVKESLVLISEDLKDGFSRFSEMEEIKKNFDKDILFCRRVINSGEFNDNPILSWAFLNSLLEIQHSAYYLYDYAKNIKTIKNKRIINLSGKLIDYFDILQKAYEENDLKYIHNINRLKKEYHFEECLRTIESSSGKESVIASYIKEIFRLIQLASSPLVNRYFDKSS